MKFLFKGNISEFKKITKSDLKLNKWLVYDESIDKRYDQVCEYSYITKLKNLATKQGLEYDETEIISWLDSQKIMLKVLEQLEKQEQDIDSFNIIQEYHIPFTNKRADYLLVKDNKILIIEFSYNKSKKSNWNALYRYQNKLNQVINYKELISNIISKNIEIGTFTFIIKPEEENEEINYKEISNIAEYIKYFFDMKICAIEELEKIDIKAFKNK